MIKIFAKISHTVACLVTLSILLPAFAAAQPVPVVGTTPQQPTQTQTQDQSSTPTQTCGAADSNNPCPGLQPTCGANNGKAGCYSCTNNCQDPAATSNCSNNSCDLIAKYLNPLINLFSVLFGLVAAISIIMGGIQYSSSEGDPQKSSKAKNRIAKTIVAVVAYLFLYAFLQFIVPGGIFH